MIVNSLFLETAFHNGRTRLERKGNAALLANTKVKPLIKMVSKSVNVGVNVSNGIFKTGRSHRNVPSTKAYFNTNVKLFSEVKCWTAAASMWFVEETAKASALTSKIS